jgi:RNA polymerase sigma-70 factor (sigma-E family)
MSFGVSQIDTEAAAAGDDRGLMAGAGRDVILGAVFTDHYAALVGLARYLVDEPGQAEEIVQEPFARTYASWERLRDPADPLPYVRRAVVNLARGLLRRRVTERRARIFAARVVPASESAPALSDRRDEIVAAVRTLPRRQRECVVLRFYDDCSVGEIASILRISEGTVKQHLHRAMGTLAGVLENDAEEMA